MQNSLLIARSPFKVASRLLERKILVPFGATPD
jgi:hypothetical protein